MSFRNLERNKNHSHEVYNRLTGFYLPRLQKRGKLFKIQLSKFKKKKDLTPILSQCV